MKENNNLAFHIFISMLTVLFIGLKLCSVISWSWWLVLSPILGPAIIGFIILAAMFIVYLVRLSKIL